MSVGEGVICANRYSSLNSPFPSLSLPSAFCFVYWEWPHQVFVKMPKRNSSVCNESTTPRRSARLNHSSPNTKKSSAKSRNSAVGLRRSPRFNNGVAGLPSLRRSPRFSDDQTLANEPKSEEELSKSGNASGGLVKSARVKKGRESNKKENSAIVAFEGIAVVDGGKGRGRNRVTFEIAGKRKRGGGGEEVHDGWTKEQELALQRAYFSAKPSPHFWKNVSKQVPGKTQQDCFDRIHHDFMTPPQSQPRSRAKTINSSPLHKFSMSASELLKPMDKTVRRSKSFKQKSFITQKSIEKLLQRHMKVDQDREGDIFSVLEPNIDIPTIALQPSPAFSTPNKLKENQGLLQSFTGTSSSNHKKTLSRFSGSRVSDIVSPPVLKQIKNRALHEKYISQLQCREARRRAASARTKKTITGQMIGAGSGIPKKDAVKEAKVALVSEAKDAISKFQQSQANFMGHSCNSDEDNDDDFGDEYESP